MEQPWRQQEFEDEQERYAKALFDALVPTPLATLTLPAKPTRWRVNQLLPEGYVTILAGEPKSGKTCFATALALAVATGTPFAGLDTVQAPVLWMCCEESPEERTSLLRHAPPCLRLPEGAPSRCQDLDGVELPCADTADYVPLFHTFHRIPIDTEPGVQVVGDLCRMIEAKLLVVDPLHGAHSGRSLQDGWAARKTLAPLKKLATELGLTVLILHHRTTRGPARVAESAQLAATASMFWVLSSLPLPTRGESLPLLPRGGGGRGVEGEASDEAPPLRSGGEGAGGRGLTLNPDEAPPLRSGGEGAGGWGHTSRLLSIHSRGREVGVNRTYYFESAGPLEFKYVEKFRDPVPDAEGYSRTLGRPPTNLELRILDELSREPQTAYMLAARIDGSLGSIRNALTRLLDAGGVFVGSTDVRERTYTLTDSMRQELPNLHPTPTLQPSNPLTHVSEVSEVK